MLCQCQKVEPTELYENTKNARGKLASTADTESYVLSTGSEINNTPTASCSVVATRLDYESAEGTNDIDEIIANNSANAMDAAAPKENADKANTCFQRVTGATEATEDLTTKVETSTLDETKTNVYKIFFVNIKREENKSNNGTSDSEAADKEATANGQNYRVPTDTVNQTSFEYCRDFFNWNDFLYSFTLGLLPTAWDVYTDITLGRKLQREEDVHSAGLCYMFVCLPPVFLGIERLTKRKNSICLQILLLGLGLCFPAGFTLAIIWYPFIFFYPAVLICFLLLGTKIIAVFLHTQEMKQFSTHLYHL